MLRDYYSNYSLHLHWLHHSSGAQSKLTKNLSIYLYIHFTLDKLGQLHSRF